MTRPTILSAYTSLAGSDEPRRVFFIGDTLQWNIVHTYDDVALAAQPYEVSLFLRRHRESAFYDNGDDFEVIWRVQRNLFANFQSAFPVTLTWINVPEIPHVSPDRRLSYPDRRRAVLGLGTDDWSFLFEEGYWSLTAVVELRESLEFDLNDLWHYRIARYRGPI